MRPHLQALRRVDGAMATRVLPCHAVRGFMARLRGLLGHPPPAPGTGWWFARCQAIHTVGMRYPIDVVFLSADGEVLRLVPQLAPWRACWQHGAAHVVELAAGQAGACGIHTGGRLRLVDMARGHPVCR